MIGSSLKRGDCMNFHYPNGRRYVPAAKSTKTIKAEKKWSYSNRGMTLEEDINETNEFYLEHGIASIHKKPTPVQIVQVDYPKRSAAVIKHQQQIIMVFIKENILILKPRKLKIPPLFRLKTFMNTKLSIWRRY
jgi:hypothetical protein